jgi:inorganic pyrophosphatase
VPEARFELARGCPRWILSPLRLPFRHSGRAGNFTLVRSVCKRDTHSSGFSVPVTRLSGFHPWHDIPTGPDPPAVVTAVIEIPTNERNKYELDKKLGVFRLDRVLHSAVHYPEDYGFLPRTLGDDGDPLDVLVLMTIPVFTGCLVEARPIGLFHLVDRGAADEKVLAVPTGDPYSDGLNDLRDIQPHYLKEIEHFFQVYKDLEGTRTVSRGFEGAEAARGAIVRAMQTYERRNPG